MYVKKVNYTSPAAAKNFCKSLKETGFGVLNNHPLDMQLVDEVFKAWAAFFASNKKYDYRFKQGGQHGYIPMEVAEKAKGCDVLDIKEFFQYYPWGDCPDELRDITQTLYDAMKTIAITLLNWIEAETPPEIAEKYSMPLSKMLEIKDETPTRTMLRILHYPALTGDEAEGAIRAAAHEDIDLITLLPAATQQGLQVQDIDGSWHDVECDPGSLIVNTGDMLQECSQGYYKATRHRVCNPQGEQAYQSRYSMPLFLHAADQIKLSDSYTAKSYLEERLKELGVLDKNVDLA